MNLYPVQQKVVDYVLLNKWIICCAEMGTGKTPMALSAFMQSGKARMLIVCPAFLVANWCKEASVWCLGKHVAELTSSQHLAEWPKGIDVLVVAYTRTHQISFPCFASANVVAADEFHLCSNEQTKRTQELAERLERNPPEYFIGLTGTPMRNAIPELFVLMYVMDYCHKTGFQKCYPDKWGFSTHFCQQLQKRIGHRTITEFYGSKNTPELHEWMKRSKFIRIKLEDVGVRLPQIFENYIASEDTFYLDEKEMKQSFERGMVTSAIKADNALAKMRTSARHAQAIVDLGLGPVLVFTAHIAAVKSGISHMDSWVESAWISGETPMKERDLCVKAFQSGKLDVLFCTIGSMGVGVTLTKSNQIIFNDVDWVPGNNSQALARVVRIGQERDVSVTYCVREGIDKQITQRLARKARDILTVMGEKNGKAK